MRFPVAVALAAIAFASAGPCFAQSCCGQPTVAYSPVVAAPPVQQVTTVNNGWYPGKYLTDFTRSVFGLNRTTYVTNYAPTASPYTVGYAPTPYTAGYAPTVQTAYRPVYPATYGPITYAPAPLTQSVSRPVVLSPVVSASPCDYGACSACSSCGVAQAGFAPAGGCSSCNAASYDAPADSSYYPEPQPALPRDANVPATRERSIDVNRPELDDSFDEPFEFDDSEPAADPAAANDYFNAPPLFPPSNRVTQRAHPAPVRTAVYKPAPATRRTAYRPVPRERDSGAKVNYLSGDAWTAD